MSWMQAKKYTRKISKLPHRSSELEISNFKSLKNEKKNTNNIGVDNFKVQI